MSKTRKEPESSDSEEYTPESYDPTDVELKTVRRSNRVIRKRAVYHQKSASEDELDVDAHIQYMEELKKREAENLKRQKERQAEAKAKKYEDIFSSVVATSKVLHNAHLVKRRKEEERVFEAARFLLSDFHKNSEDNSSSAETQSLTDSIETSPIDSDSDTDIVIEKTISPKKRANAFSFSKVQVEEVAFVCSCTARFKEHKDCHKHIIQEHLSGEQANCRSCGMRHDQIFADSICTVCGEFSAELEDHLTSHYRSSTAKGAFMECRFCVKQFRTVREVIEHERGKHIKKPLKRLTTFQCLECGECLQDYEKQLDHYVTHIRLDILWSEIEELQTKILARLGECPFCRVLFSSRKGFKCHVIKAHYQACKALVLPKHGFITPISDIEVKKEVNDMIASLETPVHVVKQEVKDEVEDDGYPAH